MKRSWSIAGFSGLLVAMAYVADVTKPEDRSKGLGLIGAAFGVGFVLGPLLGGAIVSLPIAEEWRLRLPFLVAAGFSTVAWILVFLAGVAMSPVFPTTLAVVGDHFKTMTGTAMGIVIIHWQLGWFVGEHGTGGMEYSLSLMVSLLVIAAADATARDDRRPLAARSDGHSHPA